MEISTNYLEILKERKPAEGKARNLMESIAWKFINQFSWKNETFFSDYTFFWVACNKYWKGHIPADFEKLLKWAAEREVHPRAIGNLLNKN